MNCLSGYIGLKGCSQSVPGSGLWINSLPGMPSELFDGMANGDQQTALNVFADIESTSIAQIITDTSTAFASRYKIRSVARVLDIGRVLDTNTAHAPAVLDRGFELDPGNELSATSNKSNLLGISVDELSLYLTAIPGVGDDITVEIRTESGVVLFSYTLVQTLASLGWNTIPVNMVFPCEKLVFVYDAQFAASVALPISEAVTQSWCSALFSAGCCSDTCLGTVRGINDGVYSQDAYGLTASISLVCSYDRIVCQNKKSFARAQWYLYGHHALFHALYTPSFIRENTVTREQTESLKSEYYQRYAEELKRVIDGINLNTSDLCLECNQQYRKGWLTS